MQVLLNPKIILIFTAWTQTWQSTEGPLGLSRPGGVVWSCIICRKPGQWQQGKGISLTFQKHCCYHLVITDSKGGKKSEMEDRAQEQRWRAVPVPDGQPFSVASQMAWRSHPGRRALSSSSHLPAFHKRHLSCHSTLL